MRQQRLRGYVIYLEIHSKGEVGRGVSRIWSLAVELLCQHSLPQCYIVPGSLSCKICKIQPILIQYERMHRFLDACCSLKLGKNHIFKNVNPPNSCVLLLTGEVMRIKIVPTSRFLWDSFRLVYDTYCCCSLVAKSCLTLCDPMDYSPPGPSVHGILQARILEWVAMPSSGGSSWPSDQTQVSCFGRQILYHWATREIPGAH